MRFLYLTPVALQWILLFFVIGFVWFNWRGPGRS